MIKTRIAIEIVFINEAKPKIKTTYLKSLIKLKPFVNL
jgi:hypothetical protein